MDDTGIRSLEGWRGRELALSLGKDDLGLLDNALCLVPELRVVVRLTQEARSRGVSYPLDTVKDLAHLVTGESFEVDGHQVDAKSIAHAVAKEWFPITHEGELLSAIHLAIRRCLAENAAATLEKIRREAQ